LLFVYIQLFLSKFFSKYNVHIIFTEKGVATMHYG